MGRKSGLAAMTAALALGARHGGRAAHAAPGDELIDNAGLEIQDSAGTSPLYWTSSSWADGTTTFAYVLHDPARRDRTPSR